MEQKYIPACYHPTTAVFLDDDVSYLNMLEMLVDTQKVSPKLYTNPIEALEFLKNYKPDPFIRRYLTRPEEDKIDHRNIDIDVSKIWHEIYNPSRFSEISMLIVDYAMPGLNGIDFARQCKKIKNSSFKILMLTGKADEAQAIEAFNDGVIDMFIRKNSKDLENELNSAIADLQQKYFLELSKIAIDSLTKDPDHPTITWLDEPSFIKIFEDVANKSSAVEYYLTDSFGSYMLLDANGNASWLVVKDEEDMEAAYQVAEGGQSINSDLLKSMKQYEKVLYLHNRGGLSEDADEIQKSLHDAVKLGGVKSNYYYAFIDDSKAYDIQPNKILSYRSYREKLYND